MTTNGPAYLSVSEAVISGNVTVVQPTGSNLHVAVDSSSVIQVYAAGTNGFTTVPFALQSTEMNSLGSTDTVISSANGALSDGIFSQTDTGGALQGVVTFLAGGAFGGTPVVGANIAGWFILKGDNSHFEKIVANTAAPRPPDFIIPLYNSAYSANDISSSPLVKLPSCIFKVLIQNNSGQSMAASGNVVYLGAFGIQP